MEILKNPFRATGLSHDALIDVPSPSTNAQTVQMMLARCPASQTTPLVTSTSLAAELDVDAVWVKDERGRMGLGSFKALGAAYVIACDHAKGLARDKLYVTASAGNHGLSVAAGAAAFGARAAVFIADTVPESFADRLRGAGADVHRSGATYEASMEAAADFAQKADGTLLSDSSWPGYLTLPHRLMEGYTALMAESFDQVPSAPTHLFLQAGVGGLAGAAAAMARNEWGDDLVIVVVEPVAAPALFASIKAGGPVTADGPVSVMGRLDCKEPSLIALKGLARDADLFMTISEDSAINAAKRSADIDLATTASGGAGLAGALQGRNDPELGLTAQSRVMLIFSEDAL